MIVWVAVLAVGAAGAALAVRRVRHPPEVVLDTSVPPGPTPERQAPGPIPTFAPAVAPTPLPAPITLAAQDGLGEDRAVADALAARLNGRAALGSADVAVAEGLWSRHPDQAGLRDLLLGTLQSAAGNARSKRVFSDAVTWLRRAAQLDPSGTAQVTLASTHIDAGDWNEAEAAARVAIAVRPRDASAWRALGYALLRLDRTKEAEEALRTSLEIADDDDVRTWLARVEKALADERGMSQARLSHFHLRFDGTEHADIGREILGVLERHYTELVLALGSAPRAEIPVILFSREAYYDAAGAPAWSGGVYDNIDGHIRIPIGGLTTKLTPDMDDTILHELTHAFVADRTQGRAPRDLHEGLAQYMEGDRITKRLTRDQLRYLAQGRIGGVQGFYLGALSYVEYLIAQRGMGGIKDLLDALAASPTSAEAFRKVYGDDEQTMKQKWATQLRRDYAH